MRQRVPAVGAREAIDCIGMRTSTRQVFVDSSTATFHSIRLDHGKSFCGASIVKSSPSLFGAHSNSVYRAALDESVPMNASTTSFSHSPKRSCFCVGEYVVSSVYGHSYA